LHEGGVVGRCREKEDFDVVVVVVGKDNY